MPHQREYLLILALVVAIVAVLPAALSVRVAEYDEAIFMDVARNIQRNGLPLRSLGPSGTFYFDHTPLYVYLLSLYAGASDSGLLASRLVTVAMGLACVWITFLVGERIGGVSAGAVAALLLGVNSFFSSHFFLVFMEVPMVLAMLTGLLMTIEGQAKRNDLMMAVAGLVLAGAVLFKEVAVLFTVCCTAYVLWPRRALDRPAWKSAALVGAPTLVALVGWAVWCSNLSAPAFDATMRRWLGSVMAGTLPDPRTLVGSSQWARQIVLDLYGPAWVAALALGLIQTIRLRRLCREQLLLWSYLGAAVLFSFAMHLKELRHIIGTLPIAALLIGTSIDWDGVWEWARRPLPRAGLAGIVALLVLFSGSPLRLPLAARGGIDAWLDPQYTQRVLHNDSFYGVLRLAGAYVGEHTLPDEVITVAHQATVVGYYADRRYQMLYTLPVDRALRVLDTTHVLVWDDPVFLAMDATQLQTVRNYIAHHFEQEKIIRDNDRQVIVYHRRAKQGITAPLDEPPARLR